MRILLFKVGALGDVLMTTPLLRLLRNNYPTKKIDYLVGKSSFNILKNNPHIDEIITFEENIFFKKKIFSLFLLINNIRRRRYDVIFILDKHFIFNICAFFFGIENRIGFDRLGKEGVLLSKKRYYGPIRHEIDYYLDLFKIFNKKGYYKDNKMNFKIPFKKIISANKLLSSKRLKDYFVIVNSGGNNLGEITGLRKLPNKLLKLIVEKVSEDNQVLFLGTEEEKDIYSSFRNKKNCYNLCGYTDLDECALILKKAKKIITTDNGLMHLSAAVNNKNIVCIFGPTNPLRKAPKNDGCKVIWTDKDIYNDDYELFGKKNSRDFFSSPNKIVKMVLK